MIDVTQLTKLYYSIGEVAELFGVSTSLIRYWESEFNALKPQKNRKGERRYTKKDIEVLQVIYKLVKEEGYTLDGARKHLKEAKQQSNKNKSLIKELTTIKNGLIKLKDRLG